MANVLAVALLVRLQIPRVLAGHRKFLAGFATSGVMASLLFLGCALLAPHPLHHSIGVVLGWLARSRGPSSSGVVLAALLLPQLLFALVGGLLNNEFRLAIVLERRGRNGPGVKPAVGLL